MIPFNTKKYGDVTLNAYEIEIESGTAYLVEAYKSKAGERKLLCGWVYKDKEKAIDHVQDCKEYIKYYKETKNDSTRS